jgi:hypothetical protein
MKEPDPYVYQLWLEGYTMALEIVQEVMADLRKAKAPPTWDLFEKVLHSAGEKGRAGLTPSDPKTPAH